MPLTDLSRELYQDAIIGGASYSKFNNTNARLAVGDSTTAFDGAQTDLQATTNVFRKAMDASFPQRDGNELTFRATFGEDEANFAWEEWGVFNAATGGEMLSRKVENKGTKVQGATWEYTVTVGLTLA